MKPEFAQFLSLYHVEIISVLFVLLVITGIAALVYAASASQWKRSYEAADNEHQIVSEALREDLNKLRKHRDNLLHTASLTDARLDKVTVERDNALHNLGIVRAENDSLTERLKRVVDGNADLTRRRIDLEDAYTQVMARHDALHAFVKAHSEALETLAETGLFDHTEFFSDDEEVDSVAQWIKENENASPTVAELNQWLLGQSGLPLSLLNSPIELATATEAKFLDEEASVNIIYPNRFLQGVVTFPPQVRPA